MKDRLLAAIATLGPVGSLPAPGTAGSFVALVLGVVILQSGGPGLLAAALALATVLAFPVIDAHARLTGEHDASAVIIDEVIGQWLPMLLLPAFGAPGFWWMAVAAFVLFRVFDIFKPSLIGAAENLPGAAGVIADDVLAGIAAGLVLIGLGLLTGVMP